MSLQNLTTSNTTPAIFGESSTRKRDSNSTLFQAWPGASARLQLLIHIVQEFGKADVSYTDRGLTNQWFQTLRLALPLGSTSINMHEIDKVHVFTKIDSLLGLITGISSFLQLLYLYLLRLFAFILDLGHPPMSLGAPLYQTSSDSLSSLAKGL
jgi:hypothetical protein